MKTIIQTPDQTKAIRSLVASRRAAWRNDGRTVADFPRFVPGMTTREYVELFTASGTTYSRQTFKPTARHIACAHVFADREAPYIVGPEVTAERIEDDYAEAANGSLMLEAA